MGLAGAVVGPADRHGHAPLAFGFRLFFPLLEVHGQAVGRKLGQSGGEIQHRTLLTGRAVQSHHLDVVTILENRLHQSGEHGLGTDLDESSDAVGVHLLHQIDPVHLVDQLVGQQGASRFSRLGIKCCGLVGVDRHVGLVELHLARHFEERVPGTGHERAVECGSDFEGDTAQLGFLEHGSQPF